MNQEKTTFVIIGGTSGIGEAVAQYFTHENNTVHVVSRSTGLDISDEKSVHHYFNRLQYVVPLIARPLLDDRDFILFV